MKKMVVVVAVVLVIAVASLAGCTSKGVEITAHQSNQTEFVEKEGGGVIKAGDVVKITYVDNSVAVKITNHGSGDFDPKSTDFYQNGKILGSASVIQYPAKDGEAIKYVKPGETLEFIFGGFSSNPDTLRYYDGISNKTVAISAS